jgi:hypothetical protein
LVCCISFFWVFEGGFLFFLYDESGKKLWDFGLSKATKLRVARDKLNNHVPCYHCPLITYLGDAEEVGQLAKKPISTSCPGIAPPEAKRKNGRKNFSLQARCCMRKEWDALQRIEIPEEGESRSIAHLGDATQRHAMLRGTSHR